MHLDILIFAIIAAFLIHRLNAVLGTKNEDEPQRANPFDVTEPVAEPLAIPKPFAPLPRPVELIDQNANKDGRIDTGLDEIAAVDSRFDLREFVEGAKSAFEMIVTAYSRGDLAELKQLLSQKLYADFAAAVKAREAEGHTITSDIHRIKSARIIEAHLGGAMAYITVDFDVERTAVIRNREGVVIEGDPNIISSVEDIWTFTRDMRSTDPNWVLIETDTPA